MIRNARFAALGLAGLVAATGPAAADAFDLLCKGTVVDRRSGPHAFTVRIQLDTGTREFCFDTCGGIWHLTKVSKTQILYRYDVNVADKDHAAHRYRMDGNFSTAGPFAVRETFRVDLGSGAFHRTWQGDEGDIVARHYDLDYEGRCAVAPFSGFKEPR